MMQEQEFTSIKMEVMERCAALTNVLDQITLKDIQHADKHQLLTELYNHIIKSGDKFLKVLNSVHQHHQTEKA